MKQSIRARNSDVFLMVAIVLAALTGTGIVIFRSPLLGALTSFVMFFIALCVAAICESIMAANRKE